MTIRAASEALMASLGLPPDMIRGWAAEAAVRAEKVALCRDYVAGDHPQDMTDAMRRMMRVRASSPVREFALNYTDIVVQTLADRLWVTTITGEDEAAVRWAQDRMVASRFDQVQSDIYEAAITDGDTFVLIYPDPANGDARWCHEPAFDGENGMLVFYPAAADHEPGAALKVWKIGADTRVNVYLPDRVERWIEIEGALHPFETGDQAAITSWVARDGSPLGVPVVHFRNRGRRGGAYGSSEIETAIPIQNALNRTLYSMVMAAELTAFQIRYAVGWQPPAELSPGMWLAISPERPLARDEGIQIGTLQQGELMPYLDMARYLAAEIGRITRTPSPEFGSDMASAESLKQREVGLLSKARRFTVRAGESWHRVLQIAARVEAAYGSGSPPVGARFRAVWADPDVRNTGSSLEPDA